MKSSFIQYTDKRYPSLYHFAVFRISNEFVGNEIVSHSYRFFGISFLLVTICSICFSFDFPKLPPSPLICSSHSIPIVVLLAISKIAKKAQQRTKERNIQISITSHFSFSIVVCYFLVVIFMHGLFFESNFIDVWLCEIWVAYHIYMVNWLGVLFFFFLSKPRTDCKGFFSLKNQRRRDMRFASIYHC